MHERFIAVMSFAERVDWIRAMTESLQSSLETMHPSNPALHQEVVTLIRRFQEDHGRIAASAEACLYYDRKAKALLARLDVGPSAMYG